MRTSAEPRLGRTAPRGDKPAGAAAEKAGVTIDHIVAEMAKIEKGCKARPRPTQGRGAS